jgi:hypothetical protein
VSPNDPFKTDGPQADRWLTGMPDLTDTDYDALFAVMQPDMPRIWREISPHALAQLEGTGALTITVTEAEVVVSSAKEPKTAVYRVERKRKLH